MAGVVISYLESIEEELVVTVDDESLEIQKSRIRATDR